MARRALLDTLLPFLSVGIVPPSHAENRYAVPMSNHPAEILAKFEALNPEDQQALAVEILRRTRQMPFDSGPIADDEIGEAGRAFFAVLDQEENAPTSR